MKTSESATARKVRELREAGQKRRKRMQEARAASYRELRSKDTGRDRDEVR